MSGDLTSNDEPCVRAGLSCLTHHAPWPSSGAGGCQYVFKLGEYNAMRRLLGPEPRWPSGERAEQELAAAIGSVHPEAPIALDSLFEWTETAERMAHAILAALHTGDAG